MSFFPLFSIGLHDGKSNLRLKMRHRCVCHFWRWQCRHAAGKTWEMFILFKQWHFQDQVLSRNLKLFLCLIFIWSLCLIGRWFSIRHLLFAVVEWGKGLINLFPSWFLMLKGIFFGLRKLHLVSVESYIFYLGGYSQRLCKCLKGDHISQVTQW